MTRLHSLRCRERGEPAPTQRRHQYRPSFRRNVDCLFRLMHLWIAFTVLVLSRTKRVDNRRIDDGAMAQRKAFLLQITVDDGQDRRRQLMFLQRVPEVHDRGVFRDRRAQGQVRKLEHGRDFTQRFVHGRIVQREPILQHGFQRIRFAATASFRIIRLVSTPVNRSKAQPDPSWRGTVHGVFACACSRIRNRESSSGS